MTRIASLQCLLALKRRGLPSKMRKRSLVKRNAMKGVRSREQKLLSTHDQTQVHTDGEMRSFANHRTRPMRSTKLTKSLTDSDVQLSRMSWPFTSASTSARTITISDNGIGMTGTQSTEPRHHRTPIPRRSKTDNAEQQGRRHHYRPVRRWLLLSFMVASRCASLRAFS